MLCLSASDQLELASRSELEWTVLGKRIERIVAMVDIEVNF